MRKSLSFWCLFGMTFTAVLGTLLHFLFVWTDCIALAPISAVNESTWEHMKILFFPMLFFAFIEYGFFGKDKTSFWQVKTVGILFGVALIPVLFYTYNGAFGTSPAWLNILFFFVSAAAAYTAEYLLFTHKKSVSWLGNTPVFAIVTLSVLTVTFIVFTFFPPALPLFQDPLSKAYGLQWKV